MVGIRKLARIFTTLLWSRPVTSDRSGSASGGRRTGIGQPFGVLQEQCSGRGLARIIRTTLADAPGTRPSVYDMTAQIGESGMADVCRATDEHVATESVTA
jgi:hypothetical protein